MQALLKPHHFEDQARVQIALGNVTSSFVEQPSSVLPEGDYLIDRVLTINRSQPKSLEPFSNLSDDKWQTRDGPLLHRGRLVAPEEENLLTAIIREAHDMISTAHPGRKKTLGLLQPRYHWPRMAADVAQYIQNCQTCQRTHRPRDKTPGLLHPLPIPERPWKDVAIESKEFPADKNEYILAHLESCP